MSSQVGSKFQNTSISSMNYVDTNYVPLYESYDETVDRTRHQEGMGIKQIAKECGVGIGTVYSVI